MIFIGSVFRTGKNHYPQVFLEECKHVVKEKKIHDYIINDVEKSADEEIQMKKNSNEEDVSEEESSKENYFLPKTTWLHRRNYYLSHKK